MVDDPVKDSIEFNKSQEWYSNLEKIPVIRDLDLHDWESWWNRVSNNQ